ncbi:MAG: molecular chaperone HtpG [Ruminococcaceae bacterium]|nr:molecular chaperone HtpG [Oscillospiraceae bacterium]
MTKGKISVHTDNLLPIIKKWLYSDSDIFLRELVSNAQDAIMKHKKLSGIGEAEAESKYEIHVKVKKEDGIITITDNGIGMTEDEVEKYINQVAFSGAEEFIKKYENEKDEKSKIIGHFGLGFYSAFMAAKSVEIDTLSYKEGAKPVHWVSDGGAEYEIGESDKDSRGTCITLHIADDSKQFLETSTIRAILNKYCAFLPIEIYLTDGSEEADKEIKPINNTSPLWLKNPNDCTDEEYIEFYHQVFMDFNAPLFWIHLNVDYPFNLKGILYFPKLNHELQSIEGQIKLYNNQVFIADNIKEVTPEYLMLLKGVIDCPDLPLNVSRSFLQNDGYVNKVSAHITKKVADKLTGLCKTDNEKYTQYWDDINPFVKYGCMRDEKFYDRVKDAIIFKKDDNSYVSLKDINEGEDKIVYYITDSDAQAQYVSLLKSENISMVYLNTNIDNHFISLLEYKNPELKFKRVDSYVSESIKESEDNNADNTSAIKSLFEKYAGDAKVDVQALKAKNVTAMFTISEEARRMEEMAKMYGNMGMMNLPKQEETLVVNSSNALVSKLAEREDDSIKELICSQIVAMAKLSRSSLTGDEKTEFLDRSAAILEKLLEK